MAIGRLGEGGHGGGIAGAEVSLAETTGLYANRAEFDDSVGPTGEEGCNVLTVGVHYGFSFKGFHRRQGLPVSDDVSSGRRRR